MLSNMTRTIIHRSSGPDTRNDQIESLPQRDEFGDTLVKYVPAEVLAAYIPLQASAADRNNLQWILLGVGIFATPTYLFMYAQRQAEERRPLPHFYLLAALAFVAWALGAGENTRSAIDLDATAAAVTLGAAILVIPGLDFLIEHFAYEHAKNLEQNKRI